MKIYSQWYRYDCNWTGNTLTTCDNLLYDITCEHYKDPIVFVLLSLGCLKPTHDTEQAILLTPFLRIHLYSNSTPNHPVHLRDDINHNSLSPLTQHNYLINYLTVYKRIYFYGYRHCLRFHYDNGIGNVVSVVKRRIYWR